MSIHFTKVVCLLDIQLIAITTHIQGKLKELILIGYEFAIIMNALVSIFYKDFIIHSIYLFKGT